MKIINILACLMLIAASATTWAKLPPPTDAQKVQAAEAKAKADEGAKKAAVLLGKAEDRAVANYRRNKGGKAPMAAGSKK